MSTVNLIDYVITPLMYGAWFVGQQLMVMLCAVLIWLIVVVGAFYGAMFSYTEDVVSLSTTKQSIIQQLEQPTVPVPQDCVLLHSGGQYNVE